MDMRDDFSANADFQYLAVSCDGQWSETNPDYAEKLDELSSLSQQALQNLDVDLPVHVDTYGTSRAELTSIAGPWPGYPTTMLVDRTGTIVQVWMGYQQNPEPMRLRVAEELEKL